jgi:hypothetical protein
LDHLKPLLYFVDVNGKAPFPLNYVLPWVGGSGGGNIVGGLIGGSIGGAIGVGIGGPPGGYGGGFIGSQIGGAIGGWLDPTMSNNNDTIPFDPNLTQAQQDPLKFLKLF